MISPKTYKVFEIINLIIENKERSSLVLEESVISKSTIFEDVYDFFTCNPLNNILHYNTTKFIFGFMNADFAKIKKRLTQNEKLFKILNDISNNMSSGSYRQRNCYLGHIKKLTNLFHKEELKKETDERWIRFRDQFLKLENEKENKALGDVYVNNDDDDEHSSFYFSLEEVKEKYAEFLGFKVSKPKQLDDEDDDVSDKKEDDNDDNEDDDEDEEDDEEKDEGNNSNKVKETETKEEENLHSHVDEKTKKKIEAEENCNNII